MKHLIIVGAGGFGREMCGIAHESIGYGKEFDLKGFLDARTDALAGFTGYPPILGDPSDYVPQEADVFITAFGNIAVRRRIVDDLKARGARFISLVHRTASLGINAKIGEGSLIAQHAVISADVTIGGHTSIFQGSVLGHDTRVGDFAHVYSLCSIGGEVKVGDGSQIYPGSQIVPRRTIGANAVVGIGSVVILNVPDNETVFGNPAKVIKK